MKINYWQNLDYDCHYHIYNRTVDGLTLFQSEVDFNVFLKKYIKYFQPYFSTYAYCLIPNHFHFIIKVNSEEQLLSAAEKDNSTSAQKLINRDSSVSEFFSDLFKRFFSSVAKRHNNKYNHNGAVFSERVKRVWIENDDRLRYLIAYVHHNPIHHHLKYSYGDWVYSSYLAFFSEKPSALDRATVIKLYGRSDRFLEFHKAFQVMKLEEEID